MTDPRRFWNWFAGAESRLRAFRHGRDDALLDELQGVLQSYSPGLWFEIGGHPDGPMELVICAEGDEEYFDDVENLVRCAPKAEGWKFIAFKPPQGFEFKTEYEGVLVDPAQCWFLPLNSNDEPPELGLRVAVPGLSPTQEKQYRAAVYIAIETGLGELQAWKTIKHVEVVSMPTSPEAEGYIELNELEKYLAWRAQLCPTPRSS